MKIFLNKKLTVLFLTLFLCFSACDELNQLTLNIPLVIEFSSVGPNTTTSDTDFFCLTQYSEWRDNQDDIESAKYLAASYWTLLGSTPDLQGDVSVSLFNENGGLIFSYSLGNITAADYIDNPFVLELSEGQIQALDAALNGMADNDACFSSSLDVTNITGQTDAQGNYVLNGKVEIVLETEVNTD